jgi:hypothetical protein
MKITYKPNSIDEPITLRELWNVVKCAVGLILVVAFMFWMFRECINTF